MDSAVVVDSAVFEQLDFAITRVKMQLVTSSSSSSVKYQVKQCPILELNSLSLRVLTALLSS